MTRPLLRSITARVEADFLGTGISVGQRAILEALLLADQATAPVITKILQLKRQLVAREPKELLHCEMVETSENPQHRKSVFYRLNGKSRKIISDIRHRETIQFTEFVRNFSTEDIDGPLRIQTTLNETFSKSRQPSFLEADIH